MNSKKTQTSRLNDDAITFWLSVAGAVWAAWLAAGADSDRSSLFYLFAAAYLLIHAHGFRILAEIKKQRSTE